jgi:predicted dithiol-disulfide oxidoreductase (DUF899 family)
MTALKSSADLARQASRPYPNDSAAYRAARAALLAEEIELRGHIERVGLAPIPWMSSASTTGR